MKTFWREASLRSPALGSGQSDGFALPTMAGLALPRRPFPAKTNAVIFLPFGSGDKPHSLALTPAAKL